MKNQKVYFSTFRLFFFPLDFLAVRLFFLPLDSQRLKFCTFSCACSAGKASGKNSNSQNVKNQKSILFDFSTLRLFCFPPPFDFSVFLLPSRLSTGKFCTFSCACSSGKASGKKSNSQKVKSQKVYFSTFRLFEIHNFKIF